MSLLSCFHTCHSGSGHCDVVRFPERLTDAHHILHCFCRCSPGSHTVRQNEAGGHSTVQPVLSRGNLQGFMQSIENLNLATSRIQKIVQVQNVHVWVLLSDVWFRGRGIFHVFCGEL